MMVAKYDTQEVDLSDILRERLCEDCFTFLEVSPLMDTDEFDEAVENAPKDNKMVIGWMKDEIDLVKVEQELNWQMPRLSCVALYATIHSSLEEFIEFFMEDPFAARWVPSVDAVNIHIDLLRDGVGLDKLQGTAGHTTVS